MFLQNSCISLWKSEGIIEYYRLLLYVPLNKKINNK